MEHNNQTNCTSPSCDCRRRKPSEIIIEKIKPLKPGDMGSTEHIVNAILCYLDENYALQEKPAPEKEDKENQKFCEILDWYGRPLTSEEVENIGIKIKIALEKEGEKCHTQEEKEEMVEDWIEEAVNSCFPLATTEEDDVLKYNLKNELHKRYNPLSK